MNGLQFTYRPSQRLLRTLYSIVGIGVLAGAAGFLIAPERTWANLLIVSFWLQTGFVFVELFVLPVVATPLPRFVDSALGIFNGQPGIMDIGAFVPTYGVVGSAISSGACCSASTPR